MAWTFRKFYISKDEKKWWNSQRLKETEEDWAAEGNERTVFDWRLVRGNVWAKGSHKGELKKFEFRLYGI